MQSVHIEAVKGTGDCEDCGFYDYGHFTMTFSDGTVLYGGHDGHLGGGNWDGEPATLYQWALEKLGYTVTLNGEPFTRGTYRERAPDGSWPQWTEPTMFDGTPLVVDVKLETLPTDKYEHWQYTGMATLPAVAPGAQAQVFRAVPDEEGNPANWDGDLEHVWLALLEQVCVLTKNLVVEEDEYEDDPVDEPT